MQLKLTVEYDGSDFAGWQVQPRGQRTVQAELERALGVVLRSAVRVRGAGRTDAGVHAMGQVAACRVDPVPADLDRFRTSVNGVLARDVAVRRVELVDDGFDPRRHARRRRYAYRIWNDPVRSPLWSTRSWHVRRALDVAAMSDAARRLMGRHDLESFRGADPNPPATTVRDVFESRVDAAGALLEYTIEATAFLKHMVRNIVGTLVEVGLGERASGEIDALLAACDRRLAAATAPPHGLVLMAVSY